jgi:hypothetical protein
MTDPRRLLDSEELGEGVRRALEAGAAETAPPEVRQALWAGLSAALAAGPVTGAGAGGGGAMPSAPSPPAPGGGLEAGVGQASVAGGSAPTAGAGAAASGVGVGGTAAGTITAALVAKTTAVGFTVGLGVLLAGGVGARLLAPAAPRPLPVQVADVPDPVPAERAAVARPSAPMRSATPAATDAPRPRRAGSGDALSVEARRVAAARDALRVGDAAGALSALHALAADSPQGELAEERAVLEVEALEALGRHEDAVARGSEVLRRYPDSPHAARLRETLR